MAFNTRRPLMHLSISPLGADGRHTLFGSLVGSAAACASDTAFRVTRRWARQ